MPKKLKKPRKNPSQEAYKMGYEAGITDLTQSYYSDEELDEMGGFKGLKHWLQSHGEGLLHQIDYELKTLGKYEPWMDDYNSWELGYFDALLRSLKTLNISESLKQKYRIKFTPQLEKIKTRPYKSTLLSRFTNDLRALQLSESLKLNQFPSDAFGDHINKFVVGSLVKLGLVDRSLLTRKYKLTSLGKAIIAPYTQYNQAKESDPQVQMIINYLKTGR